MSGLVRWLNDRRSWTGVVLVLLGAITSIVVALAVAVLGPAAPAGSGATVRIAAVPPVPGLVWLGRRGTSIGRVRWQLWADLADAHTQTETRARPPRWVRPPRHPAVVEHNGYGWPLICLTASLDNRSNTGHTYVVVRGWSASSGDVWLPRSPQWPGLAANTAFYAAAWWLLLGAPRRIRRWRRARRGACLRCAYDLRGISGACPECGFTERPG